MSRRKPHMWRGGLRLTQAARAVGVDPDQVLSVLVFSPWNYVFYQPNDSEQILLARLRRDADGGLQMVGEPLDEHTLDQEQGEKFRHYFDQLRAAWEAK